MKIGQQILERERKDKVLPNIVEPLTSGLEASEKTEVLASAFGFLEQCKRLVSYCLGKPLEIKAFQHQSLDRKYEEGLISFFPEHPFLQARAFRNIVFEAISLAEMLFSSDDDAINLALEYVSKNKSNYYLIYFLEKFSHGRSLPVLCLDAVIGSALELRSRNASINIAVEGELEDGQPLLIDVQCEIVAAAVEGDAREFSFSMSVGENQSINLSERLGSIYISAPCEVILAGREELELYAPVEIHARSLKLISNSLVLRSNPKSAASLEDRFVILEAQSFESTCANLVLNSINLSIITNDNTSRIYPLARYFEAAERSSDDPLFDEKLRRLRRILTHFRSHSKGTLAKYKDKIEHERVAGNKTGNGVLNKLCADGVLRLQGAMYFLEPEKIDEYLGVTWIDLRKGKITRKLAQYVNSIPN